jgi:Zn finger protein HypA/HybF involved in hydrogenase expression
MDKPVKWKVTLNQIMAAIEADDCLGFCLACGEEAYNVEPDARRYTCESCGKAQVYGAKELLIMGIGI